MSCPSTLWACSSVIFVVCPPYRLPGESKGLMDHILVHCGLGLRGPLKEAMSLVVFMQDTELSLGVQPLLGFLGVSYLWREKEPGLKLREFCTLTLRLGRGSTSFSCVFIYTTSFPLISIPQKNIGFQKIKVKKENTCPFSYLDGWK